MTMARLFYTAILALAFAVPTSAADDRVPQQFQGSWCASGSSGEDTIFNRSNTCKSAHVPEDHIILRPDRLLISDIAECKFLETVSITRHGTHRLKFWCKSRQLNDQTWMYEIFVSAHNRNKLAVQEVEP